MRLVLFGGGGAVGTDIGSAFAARGQDFDVVEADYLIVNGERIARAGLGDADIARLVGAPGNVWVNLTGLGDAYRCGAEPELAVRLNVTQAVAHASLASTVGLPMIHLSTWEVYGAAGSVLQEDSTCRPTGTYASTKHLGEVCALRIGEILGNPIVALRIGPVIGPTMRRATALRSFVESARAGEALRLRNGGTQARQFLDYRDLADLVARMAQAPQWTHNAYNVASEASTSIADLAHLVLAKYPGSELIQGPLDRVEPPTARLSIDRLRSDYDWLATTTMSESLDHLAAAWFGDR